MRQGQLKEIAELLIAGVGVYLLIQMLAAPGRAELAARNLVTLPTLTTPYHGAQNLMTVQQLV